MRKFTARGNTTNVFDLNESDLIDAKLGRLCKYCSLSSLQKEKNPLGGYCATRTNREPLVVCGMNTICISSAKDLRRLPIALRKLILFK